MADFSISKALGSGFGLIARRPGSVLAWSAAYLVIAIVPMALMFGYVMPDFQTLMASTAHAGLHPVDPLRGPPPELLQFQNRMMMFNPIMLVIGLAARALLVGAIYRSILEPDNRRYFSLRFSTQELWLALVLFVYGLMVVFALMAVMLGGGAIGGLVWLISGLLPDPTAVTVTRAVLTTAVVVAGLGAWIWVAIRLSLGPVMTFVDKEFRLFESWGFTKDHAWKLTGLMVLVSIIAIGIGLVLELVIFAIMFAQLGGFDASHLHALFPKGQLPDLGSLLVTLGPIVVLGGMLVGPMLTIIVAPLATAYRELRGN